MNTRFTRRKLAHAAGAAGLASFTPVRLAAATATWPLAVSGEGIPRLCA